MRDVEFTIEPFVDGEPGPHVLAAVRAVESTGATVTFGPFASACRVDDDALPALVAALMDAAFANGATNVNVNVAQADGPPPDGVAG